MKNICYNKDTKEKETNKKCFKFSIRRNQCTIEIANQEDQQKGRRDTSKEKNGKEGTKSDDSLPSRGESLKRQVSIFGPSEGKEDIDEFPEGTWRNVSEERYRKGTTVKRV